MFGDTRSVGRSDLYDMVWQRPISQIAPELGISGPGLAKLCERHGIPVPERGYWAKLQSGKRVRRKPPLPSLKPGQSERILIKTRPVRPQMDEGSMPTPLAKLLAGERAQAEPIFVPRTPKLHPLVAAWPKPRKPSYGAADWSPAAESRRRRIASVLFQEVEKRGGKVEIDHDSKFNFSLFGQAIEVTLRERLKKVVISNPKATYDWDRERTEWHPIGLLRLRFENYLDVPIRREFNETEETLLEAKLREILVAWLLAVEAERQRNERLAHEVQERHERELRRLERQEAERKQREEWQRLLGDARAWSEAQLIRSYVAAVVEKDSEGTSEWARWALGLADETDPIGKHVGEISGLGAP